MTPHDLGLHRAAALGRGCLLSVLLLSHLCGRGLNGLPARLYGLEISWPLHGHRRVRTLPWLRNASSSTPLRECHRTRRWARDRHLSVWFGEGRRASTGCVPTKSQVTSYEKYGQWQGARHPDRRGTGFTGHGRRAAMTGLRPDRGRPLNMGLPVLAFKPDHPNNMGCCATPAAALHDPHGGARPRRRGAASSGGGAQPSAWRPISARARHSKIVAVSHPTNAKGLMKAAIPRQHPVLSFEAWCCSNNLSENCPRVITSAPSTRRRVVRGRPATRHDPSPTRALRPTACKGVQQARSERRRCGAIDLISLKPFDLEDDHALASARPTRDGGWRNV